MKTFALAVALTSVALSTFAQGPALNCNVGPAHKTIGGSAWLVYACDDKHSVVAVTDAGSAAAPFYFMFSYDSGGYHLRGEGTGNKAATDAAYRELSQLKQKEIEALFSSAVGGK